MRDLHEQMLAAVLEGDGLAGIAELAAHEVGGPVAILLPARGLSTLWPVAEAPGLETWAAEAIAGRNGSLPEGVEVAVPVLAAGEQIGRVAALGPSTGGPAVDREEVLRVAGLAALTALAVVEERDRVAEELRGSLIEDLRAGGIAGEEIVRRAKRLGCDLSGGAIAVAALAAAGKPRYMAAIVSAAAGPAGTICEPLGDRVFALLPASGGEDAEAVRARAGEIVKRLQPHGPAAASGLHPDPAEAPAALEEAELVLEVVARDPRLAEQLAEGIPSGVYRLLFRALASNPAEVVRFYEDTVEPLVSHDRDYRTDLLETLEAYLAHDCNMRATAEAVYAHRHTVAHRLERIRELSGLDPASGSDRERFGLGIKAYRLIEPTLPR
jgi:sugar diacid utilization regulator